MLRKLSRHIKRRIAKTLAAAVVVGCPLSASAMENIPIYWGDKQIFDVQYYGTEDSTEFTRDFYTNTLGGRVDFFYNFTPEIKASLNRAFLWWAEIIGPGAMNNQPVQYFVKPDFIANASAQTMNVLNNDYDRCIYNPDWLAEIIQNGRLVPYYSDLNAMITDIASPEKAFALIALGQNIGINENDGNYGWINPPYYALPLPQSMKHVDIAPTVYHEIAHSLGILVSSSTENPYGLKSPGTKRAIISFGDGASNPQNFTSHLRDQYGNAAREGMLIITPDMFNNETLRAQYLEATGKELTAADVFIMDKVNAMNGRNGLVYSYFVGDNVLEVLDGKTFTRADGVEVSGIPINSWENAIPELSHIELARSIMSHQLYRSYANFTEAELAVMQDIGYDIDRKNFYGRSIYNDGVTLINDQGFSARRNGQYVDGYNSSTMGVGLHVFGSNNNITQRGNIWTNGYGAVGIRVDGLNNKVNVQQGTEIHSDGTQGVGVLVAYGKNHDVTIDGTVTANGNGGNAVHFDFGANPGASFFEYRGSYIRYFRTLSNMGQISRTENFGLNEVTTYDQSQDYDMTDRINGDTNEKMGSLTVNGRLESNGGNAIYIAKNSFVDKININKGAELNGNITSLWKQFDTDSDAVFDSEQTVTYQEINVETDDLKTETKTTTVEPLYIQYNGGKYPYNRYIPDLVTQLNFNALDGDIFYNGDINGFDNMKLNITSGTLYYGGAANVVNVNVLSGAKLFGGTYIVNDMTSRMAEGFIDWTTGKFFNHGTIGAMTINGDLLSDGTLQGVNGSTAGNIIVNGSAYVEGSTATATNILPGESAQILTATNGVTGNLRNAKTPTPVSGMTSTTGAIVGNTIQTTAHAANNLGELNHTQAMSYDAATNMVTTLVGDTRREQLRPLYSADAATAKVMLEQMGSSMAPQMMSYAQQNSLVKRLITDRFATKDFSGDAWIKFTKDWGKLHGGDKFHGEAISVGWDRNFSDKWRGGVFVSYDATSLERGEVKDTRGGIYGGLKSGADEAFVYVDGGQVRNKLSRSIDSLGLGATAKYHGTIVEIGGEYKHDLTPDKSYHLSPFVNLQASRLKQDGYHEHGAGIYNQRVRSKSNTYFAGQVGLEYRKVFDRGNIAARLGVLHAFSGAEPELSFSYEGGGNTYRLRNKQDKTHLVMSLSGENEFATNWTLGGELYLQKGSHDRDLSASLFLRRVW